MNKTFEIDDNSKLDLILQSNGTILYHMGIAYAEGTATGQPDHHKACDLYRQAALLGNSEAMYCLAISYSNGYGVDLDHSAACDWYKQAAERGHSQSLYNLGLCYENGWGVPIDCDTAFKFFHRAAELGNNDAIHRLS